MLNVITPCSRPGNLVELKKSIDFSLKSARKDWNSVRWIVVVDGDETEEVVIDKAEIHYLKTTEANGLSGNPQRNYGLDLISEGYVYFLDDDNIMHPDYLEFFFWFESNHEELAFVTAQVWKNHSIRLIPHSNSMCVGGVDTAQLTLPRSLIGDMRWDPFNYCADGALAEALFSKYPNRFIFVPKVLCYYNYLRRLI